MNNNLHGLWHKIHVILSLKHVCSGPHKSEGLVKNDNAMITLWKMSNFEI